MTTRKTQSKADRTKELTNPAHIVRLRNVNDLIERRFHGNASDMARAIGKSHTYLWQLVQKERRIGEKTARHIEEALGLDYGDLDRDGSFERTDVLTEHLGDGRTRTYRLVPKVVLGQFDSPSVLPENRRVCAQPCSEHTVWFRHESSMNPQFPPGTEVFVDRDLTMLEDAKRYVVRVKSGPVKGIETLREARRTEIGYILVSQEPGNEPLAQKDVKVLGRVISSETAW